MKEPRHARSLRDRKSHLSPDAERLVATALGLQDRLVAEGEQRVDRGVGDEHHVPPPAAVTSPYSGASAAASAARPRSR